MNKQRTVAHLARLVLCMFVSQASADPISGQGTWESTLQPRYTHGQRAPYAFFDTALNITWAADWSLAGERPWRSAVDWAGQVTIGGLAGWRLPKTIDTGQPGCDFSYGGTDCGPNPDPLTSEMAHMFYVTLGNRSYCPLPPTSCEEPQPGWGLSNTALFEGMQADHYWSGTANANSANDQYAAWGFDFYGGGQGPAVGDLPGFSVAVRDGDVPSVPELPTVALAMLGLIAVWARARMLSRRAQTAFSA